MKNLANFLLFNAGWFAAVWGAAQGWIWLGPLAFGAMVVHHLLAFTPAGERRSEVLYLLGIGVVGLTVDSLLHAAGLLRYPTSESAWTLATVPPWIVSLWIGFATLPRMSLGWLASKPWWLAVVLGAIGGPLSFHGGTTFESIAAAVDLPWTTYAALGIEYAVLMPLMLRYAPAHRPGAQPDAPSVAETRPAGAPAESA